MAGAQPSGACACRPGAFASTAKGLALKAGFPRAEKFKTTLATQVEGESTFPANHRTEVEFIKPITARCSGKGGKRNHI